jgi:hypothetical protein
MTWLRQAAEHDADHRKADEGGSGSAIALEIARHASAIALEIARHANVRSTIQRLGKTSKPTAVAERSTTLIFHRPVFAAAFAAFAP